jgi:hypothetical protein
VRTKIRYLDSVKNDRSINLLMHLINASERGDELALLVVVVEVEIAVADGVAMRLKRKFIVIKIDIHSLSSVSFILNHHH